MAMADHLHQPLEQRDTRALPSLEMERRGHLAPVRIYRFRLIPRSWCPSLPLCCHLQKRLLKLNPKNCDGHQLTSYEHDSEKYMKNVPA